MEQIIWVETPPCRICKPLPEYKRRLPCRGCEKLLEQENAAQTKGRRNNTNNSAREVGILQQNAQWRAERDRRILRLRAKGLSYARIAKTLNMPKATVQSAAASALKREYIAGT